jgi:hypothetical protein
MRFRRCSTLLLLGLSLNGCFFPYLEQHRPRIDGLVVGAQGQPLAGTPIIARTLYESGRALCFDTRSDGTGRFRIPRHREWNVWMPMTRPLGAMTLVTARVDELRSATVNVDNRKSRVRVTLGPTADVQPATLEANRCAPQ